MPSLSRQKPLFLGWDQPWLPRLADYLLLKNSDFSQTVIILPGQRACRRLLALLALLSKERSQPLTPPILTTLEEAAMTFLEIPETLKIAEKGISHLAWQQAALALTPQELQSIQFIPQGMKPGKELVRKIASLGERLASELLKAGYSIEEVLQQAPPFSPESADREEPRWRALARLQKEYTKILSRWHYHDRAAVLKQKLQEGVYQDSKSFLVAGVVDFSPLFFPFFEKTKAEVIVIAPEQHANGFHDYGNIVPSYWQRNCVEVPKEIIIPCERSDDQASRAWEVVTTWLQEAPQKNITLIAPEGEALPLLRARGASIGFETRWAGGQPFRGGALFLLLEALQKLLDRPPNQSPRLSAVIDLLHHPIAAKKIAASLGISSEFFIRELDDWATEHLSLFLEEAHLMAFQKEKTLIALLKEIEKNFTFALEPEPLEKVLKQFRSLLLYLLGEEKLSRSNSKEHIFLESFEKLLLLLEELENLASSTKLFWKGSDFVLFLLEVLSKESIPELEQREAIEMIGWLEAPAEDAPSLIITSFHEGSVPTASKNDPLLSERLRKRLGLNAAEDQLARDHYYLHLLLASRKKEGGIAILAPRYNARNEPVRPSRLLLQGCPKDELPQRILSLTQRQLLPLDSFKQKNQDSHFTPHPIALSPVERLTVTSLRTYLKSPRLFYFQHILKLREVLEAPVEMKANQFGMLLHRLLASFSADRSLREEKKESVIFHWLEKALDRAFQWQFGKNPAPAVSSQQGEILRALRGFARAEAAHRAAGWETVAVEEKSDLSFLVEEKLDFADSRSVMLQGRIDRLDWHREENRWLLLDYKTSHHQEWKKETPNRVHFKKSSAAATPTTLWYDLQLPLYLKLSTQLDIIKSSGLPSPTIENTDLCFFQLPIHPDAAGISEPFDPAMVEPAWEEAARVLRLILDGHFEEIGTVDAAISPTWKALCGMR